MQVAPRRSAAVQSRSAAVQSRSAAVQNRLAAVQSRGVGLLRDTRPMHRRRESTGNPGSEAYSRVWLMERELGPIPSAQSTGTSPKIQRNAQHYRAMRAQGLMPCSCDFQGLPTSFRAVGR
jgi:hypothetical protein